MSNTRDIRRRIRSVKNTQQITKAMELVAASKMKRAQQSALAGHPYAALMAEMLASLSGRADVSQHPFLAEREVKTRGILVVSTDRGLCGPLNSNLFRLITETTDAVKYTCIGRKAAQFLGRTGRDLSAEFDVEDRVPFSQVKVISEFMTKQFLEGEIDTIEILYPRFVNTLVQKPTLHPLLPLSNLQEMIEVLRSEKSDEPGTQGLPDDPRDMAFEPDPTTVLSELLPLYINQQIYHFVLDAKASEHSARMVAMKTASDNAGDLLDDLTLAYNKARQAAITQEILEISAAAAANA
ncbi:MAG TPA: ATP synthase F1 subunit gamma [Opitutales bacterium]|nr:ATP synthase F1 subunit gamma [Opitutales bacterium]